METTEFSLLSTPSSLYIVSPLAENNVPLNISSTQFFRHSIKKSPEEYQTGRIWYWFLVALLLALDIRTLG